MKKKKIRTGDKFQKSIESTVKAISEEKNLNIYFGDTKNNNKSDIILPIVNSSSELSDIKKIRGMSDSASLIKKYHDNNLHKKLSPSKEDKSTDNVFPDVVSNSRVVPFNVAADK